MSSLYLWSSTKTKNLKIKIMTQVQEIKAFGVYYVPNHQGKMFAGLKSKLLAAFENQVEAIKFCDSANMGETLDELHIGYRVYPMQWIPKGTIVNR
jgi:hypothetical protein